MEKKQSKGILWRVLFVISALMMFAVLELGKHTVRGWILTALLLAGFWFLRATRWKTFSADKRILTWVCMLGVGFAAVLWISWPPVQAVPAVKGSSPEKTGVIHVAWAILQASLPLTVRWKYMREFPTRSRLSESFAGRNRSLRCPGRASWRRIISNPCPCRRRIFRSTIPWHGSSAIMTMSSFR